MKQIYYGGLFVFLLTIFGYWAFNLQENTQQTSRTTKIQQAYTLDVCDKETSSLKGTNIKAAQNRNGVSLSTFSKILNDVEVLENEGTGAVFTIESVVSYPIPQLASVT